MTPSQLMAVDVFSSLILIPMERIMEMLSSVALNNQFQKMLILVIGTYILLNRVLMKIIDSIVHTVPWRME